MRFLITGATGLLGPYLHDAAARLGAPIGVARAGAEETCDLENHEAVAGLLGRIQPGIVLHAAAMTHVDRCEDDPVAAERANAQATRNLVAALPPGARFVYISTDQVYPDTTGLKREGEEAPVNAYGRSKLAGEQAALARAGSLVLRCNMFGPSRTAGRSSFSDWIIGSLRRGDPITLFTDALFSPLQFDSLATLTLEAAQRGLSGTFNAGSRNGTSKRDFAVMIARHLGLSLAATTDGISTAVPMRAPRPLDLRMDVSKLEAALGRSMPTLEEEVNRL